MVRDAWIADEDKPTLREVVCSRGVPADDFEALFPLCRGLDLALATSHFRRVLDLPAYFRRFSAAELADHLRLLSRLSEGTPVSVTVGPHPGSGELDVVIAGRDGQGVAAAVTTHLWKMGLNIRDIRVVTQDAGLS